MIRLRLGCQEDNRGSVEVHIYANNPANNKPPGTFVTADIANQNNEPAVDRECHDANGGKHRFTIALPNQVLRGVQGKKLFAYGIHIAGNVENSLLAGSGNFLLPAPKWPPDPPTPCLVPGGFCPIRTNNILDPSSWRGWDGKDFTVAFADPYRGTVANPAAHVCKPVEHLDFSTGFNYYEPAHLFIATIFTPGETSYGPAGVYFSTSSDFVHWSQPALAITMNQMLRREPEGNWSYQYFSLIDPKSSDPNNFQTITTAPYLYYVRMDGNHPPYQRSLFRQKIKLAWLFGQNSKVASK